MHNGSVTFSVTKNTTMGRCVLLSAQSVKGIVRLGVTEITIVAQVESVEARCAVEQTLEMGARVVGVTEAEANAIHAKLGTLRHRNDLTVTKAAAPHQFPLELVASYIYLFYADVRIHYDVAQVRP